MGGGFRTLIRSPRTRYRAARGVALAPRLIRAALSLVYFTEKQLIDFFVFKK
jgi:hypothetical protein